MINQLFKARDNDMQVESNKKSKLTDDEEESISEETENVTEVEDEESEYSDNSFLDDSAIDETEFNIFTEDKKRRKSLKNSPKKKTKFDDIK